MWKTLVNHLQLVVCFVFLTRNVITQWCINLLTTNVFSAFLMNSLETHTHTNLALCHVHTFETQTTTHWSI